ncbi:DUF1987 domain-containing protein [Flexithrix dorotheae]|uniref:DUF1987 domain-containing protein n=1 Tax=Flexithrix dorotheae TaxID=70993 RepID=UPI0003793F80|nr:DUF1987 domain-containing protein [Flexithrix dorotheae]
MERFYIKGEEFVPEIDLNPDTNILKITGESYHEYTHEFFQPVFDWLEEYTKTEGRNIKLSFRMDYFNTASSKCFFDIIDLLGEYEKESGSNLEIFWYYEDGDIDMLESGEDYLEESGTNIKLIPYNSKEELPI